MPKLLSLLALVLLISACAGPQVPCDDSDPVGPCATSHSHTYDGGGRS
jgi:hypothetical protein